MSDTVKELRAIARWIRTPGNIDRNDTDRPRVQVFEVLAKGIREDAWRAAPAVGEATTVGADNRDTMLEAWERDHPCDLACNDAWMRGETFCRHGRGRRQVERVPAVAEAAPTQDVTCPHCHGEGYEDDADDDGHGGIAYNCAGCETCRGKGRIRDPSEARRRLRFDLAADQHPSDTVVVRKSDLRAALVGSPLDIPALARELSSCSWADIKGCNLEQVEADLEVALRHVEEGSR